MVAQVSAYTQRLFEPSDILEIRRLPSRRRSWHLAGELAGIADDLKRENDKGQNIHVGANPRFRDGGSKAADVAIARSIFADFDHTSIADARDRWQRIGMDDPTLTIASGHGVHGFWRLQEPMTDLAAWTARQRDLADKLGSDPAVIDPPRMMRLPGFLNHKPPPAPCRIIGTNDTRIGAWTPAKTPNAHGGGDIPTSSVLSVLSVHGAKNVSVVSVHAEEIDAAIALTVPDGPGQRHRAVFELARHLRAVPGLAGVSVRRLRPVVTRWHQRSLTAIRTKDFDTSWSDFIEAWPLVRMPAFADPLGELLRSAEAAPDPPEAAIYDTHEARTLVCICFELQRRAGDRPFYLACRTAAGMLGIGYVAASQLLRMLVADGLLIVTKRNTTRKATRYRYVGAVAK